MFTRIGAAAFKKDLTNTLRLCEVLGNPQHKFRCIHIAGTNGKGSTSHMTASILQEAGYKTGLYTSPHLVDFRERIRINGQMIPQQEVVDFVADLQEAIEDIQPSFFELTVALCFAHFAKHNVDYAVIETGLGGRLDSTNVISPMLSVITNIGYDHMDMLGDTLEKIAYEKAGIIKKNTPVVIGKTQTETKKVFEDKAREENAPVIFCNSHYQIADWFSENGERAFVIASIPGGKTATVFHTPLTGNYQKENVVTVYTAVKQLQETGLQISDENISRGYKNVLKNTGLRGRWEKLGEHPLIICDTGHNEDGIRYIVEQIAQQNFAHLHIVLGMVKDKAIDHILALLPKNARYYFCKAGIPRALDASLLREQAAEYHLHGETYPSVHDAFLAAKQQAKPEDMIFVGGSTFVVAEIME